MTAAVNTTGPAASADPELAAALQALGTARAEIKSLQAVVRMQSEALAAKQARTDADLLPYLSHTRPMVAADLIYLRLPGWGTVANVAAALRRLVAAGMVCEAIDAPPSYAIRYVLAASFVAPDPDPAVFARLAPDEDRLLALLAACDWQTTTDIERMVPSAWGSVGRVRPALSRLVVAGMMDARTDPHQPALVYRVSDDGKCRAAQDVVPLAPPAKRETMREQFAQARDAHNATAIKALDGRGWSTVADLSGPPQIGAALRRLATAGLIERRESVGTGGGRVRVHYRAKGAATAD